LRIPPPDGRAAVLQGFVAALLLAGGAVAAVSPPGPPTPAQRLEELRGLAERRQYEAVIPLARGLLAQLAEASGTPTPAVVEARTALAQALHATELGSSSEAQAAAEQAVADARSLTPAEPALLVRALVVLADGHLALRNAAAAKPLVEEAVALAEEQLGDDHPDTWNALRALSDVHLNAGRPREARALLERALAAATHRRGPDSPDCAVLLISLAAAARRGGDLTTALDAATRGLAARAQVFGAEHVLTTLAHNVRGLVLRDTGDLAGARAELERALAGLERAHGPDHLAVAGVLHNLGNLARRLGDLDAAQRHLERALAIREQRLGPADVEVAHSLNSLALVARDRGELATARGLLERSLQVREAQLGSEHPSLAVPLQNLAEVLADLGQFDAARALDERALRLRERALGPDHPEVALLVHNLAILNANLGRAAEARGLAERAYASLRASFGPDHPRTAVCRATLARLQALGGDFDAAVENALAAEKVLWQQYWLTARYLAEREALAFARSRGEALDVALTVARAVSPAQRRRVWEAVAGGRAQAFSVVAARRRAVASARGEAGEALAALERARETYAALLVKAAGGEDPPAAAELERARLAAEEAERRLAERFPATAAENGAAHPSAAAVAALLPPGSALVSFVRYRADFAEPLPGLGDGSGLAVAVPAGRPMERYGALILRPDDERIPFLPLGAAEEIDALVGRWAAEVGRGALDAHRSPHRSEAACRQAGEALRRAVWDPLTAHLHGVRLVFVVPEGDLHMVSWYALPRGRAGYLVEDGTLVHLLAAEHDLLELAAGGATGRGLLAVGGASYDGAGEGEGVQGSLADAAGQGARPALRGLGTDCRSLRGARFEPIPGTMREVAAVADLWARAAGSDEAQPLVLTGVAASEAAVKATASGRRVLHLATHGFFTGPGCSSAEGGVRGIGGLAPAPQGTRLASFSPPLSGLALAGANARGRAEGANDGVLIAEEAAGLDLSGVEWAVLSACDTGAGTIQAGEGVLGLQRAFRLAGVRTVIMSLWGVRDEEARQWMVALYRARLLRGASTAEAVRAASCQLLEQQRLRGHSTHPFYWAAFVALGDWH